MSFRDDHEATLARAQALERKLGRTEAQLEKTRARLAQAEGESAALTEQLRRALVRPAKPAPKPAPVPVPAPIEIPPPPPAVRRAPMPPARPGDTSLSLAVVIVGLGVAIFAYAAHLAYRTSDVRPEAIPCRLDSTPTGARVYAIDVGTDGPGRLLGTTPLIRDASQWIREQEEGVTYELRRPRHAARPFPAPLDGNRCADAHYDLR